MIYYSKNFGEYDTELSDKYLTSAFKLDHKLINKFIEYMESENKLTPGNYPKLTAQIGSRKNKDKMKTVSFKKNFKNLTELSPDKPGSFSIAMRALFSVLKADMILAWFYIL